MPALTSKYTADNLLVIKRRGAELDGFDPATSSFWAERANLCATRAHVSRCVDHKTVLARPGIEPGSILLGIDALSVAPTGHTVNFDVQELHVRVGTRTRCLYSLLRFLN